MSVSSHRVPLFRQTDALVCAAILISGACYHAPSVAPQPGVVEPSRQRQQSMDDAGFPRFAGVDVVPLERSRFVIRIHSGMVGDGDPLYVIDGARMRIPPNRGIDWFKPEDIAEIKVLKYPHELAEYGPNGVNGVIVITTKQNAGRSRRF
jgi:hypothetical protein